MDPTLLLSRFATAVAVGLLVGLQREFAKQGHRNDILAGARTFALIALSGALSVYTSEIVENPAVFAVALLIFGMLLTAAYVMNARTGEVGLTTEVAAFVVFMAGALCARDQLALAAALGVTTTTLLALKPEAQRFVARLGRADVVATLKLAVISALVLPVLPRTTFGPPPFDAVSPFKLWLMVVFISGLSFLGYVLIQIVGARRGVGLTGLLGGLASSTAVTLSLAQRSRRSSGLARPLALGILVAWIVMFARILLEIGVVNPALLRSAWMPIVAGGAAGGAWATGLYLRGEDAGKQAEPATFSNPFELKPAIQFGLLYGAILVAVKAASMYLGTSGVYVSAIVSGMADVDAITLSMAELSLEHLSHETAERAIVLAAASNTLVKGGIVVFLGSPAIRPAILPGVVLIAATSLAVSFAI